MTPILRRSKESARRQRSRPESERIQDVPHSRPLADRIRPTPQTSHENYSRKRPHNKIGGRGDTFEPPRSKFSRRSPPPPPRLSRREGHRGGHDRGRGGRYDSRNRPSYEEYLRSATRNNSSSRGNRHHRGQQPQEDDYLYERRSSRPSYERSVDLFLKRTGDTRRYRR